MKTYDADDGDRWREARKELQAKCCGEVDVSGTCFAPACRQGEALKAMDEMLEHIESSDVERKRLSSTVAPTFEEIKSRIFSRMGGHTIDKRDWPAWKNFMGLLQQMTAEECGLTTPRSATGEKIK